MFIICLELPYGKVLPYMEMSVWGRVVSASMPDVKVVLNLAVEKHRKCTDVLRPSTNRIWLQLIRSCTFLVDPGVPILES